MRRAPLVLLLTAACGGESEPPECVDGDGDGVPAAPCGDDCDDADPRRADPRECSALCTEDPRGFGCPCEEGTAAIECYTAIEETRGVGACRGGARRCDGGLWTSCEDEVRPSLELCNLADDDCDGFVDDGVALDGCGRCPMGMSCDCWGSREACEGWGGETVGLREDEAGALTLSDPTGRWSVVRPCAGASAFWHSITIDAEVPDGAAVELAARMGDDPETLGAEVDLGTVSASGETFDLDAAFGDASALVIELRAVLFASANGGSPALREVRLEFDCFDAGGP